MESTAQQDLWSGVVGMTTTTGVCKVGLRCVSTRFQMTKSSAMANRMLDLGADGVITDNTSILWRTIAFQNGNNGRLRQPHTPEFGKRIYKSSRFGVYEVK
jgi:hypothetical protein